MLHMLRSMLNMQDALGEERRMKFSEKVQEARKKKNMTQTELAHALHVSPRAVAGWEAESRKPKQKKTIENLARILDCELSYFLVDDPVEIDNEPEFSPEEQSRRILEQAKVLFGSNLISEGEKQKFILDLLLLMFGSTQEIRPEGCYVVRKNVNSSMIDSTGHALHNVHESVEKR